MRRDSRTAYEALKAIGPNVETFEMMKKAGLNTEIFSGGGTGTYNIMHLVPGCTDVQVGSICSRTCSTWR